MSNVKEATNESPKKLLEIINQYLVSQNDLLYDLSNKYNNLYDNIFLPIDRKCGDLKEDISDRPILSLKDEIITKLDFNQKTIYTLIEQYNRLKSEL